MAPAPRYILAMTHAQLTPELIVDLLFEPRPTPEICATHKLAITELLEIVRSDQYERIHHELTEIDRARAPALRRKLMWTLEHIATQPAESRTHAETIRKATALLLRLTNPDPHDAQPTDAPAPAPETPDPPPANFDEPDLPDDTTPSPSPPASTRSRADTRTRGKAAQRGRLTTPITPRSLTAAAGRPISVRHLTPTTVHPRPPPQTPPTPGATV